MDGMQPYEGDSVLKMTGQPQRIRLAVGQPMLRVDY